MNPIRALLFCILIAPLGSLYAAEPAKDAAAAINRSGELRMLSQRIVKSYAQIGMRVESNVARMVLSESVRRFFTNLSWLEDCAVVAPADLEPIQNRWHEFSLVFHSRAELERAMALNETAEAILKDAETLTKNLQANAAQGSFRMVNVAGRQRMLSQRVAKAYMLQAWGGTKPELDGEMEAAAREFRMALGELRDYPDNSSAIRSEIEELSLQWEWLEAAMATEGIGSYRLIVAESSEAILASADRLTVLYERLANAE